MEKNSNIEVKRILDIIKGKKILIIFMLLVFCALGYFYSFYYVTPVYKASTTLLLIPNSNDDTRTITNSDLTLNSGLISTYSNIANNSKILNQVIENLNLNMTERQLARNLRINVVDETHIMEVSVMNANPELAMNITKELADVFLKEIKQIYNLDNIGIIDEVKFPQEPANINHIKDISIFLFIGITICGLYISAIYIFDNTIKNEEDVKKYINLKSLGNIPINIKKDKNTEIVNRKDAKSYITECINTIRTNILYMNSIKNAKTILITSCTPRDGKSWVSANMAVSFAETDKKVLLVDADMRKGRANKIFKVDNQQGLSDYLYNMVGDIKKDLINAKNYIQETDVPNLHILTNGTIPPNPSELVQSENMKELINILKNMYDIVIFDAPPCKLVSDGVILSNILESTVIVTEAGKTKINDMKDIKKSIQIAEGNIIGVILNKLKISKKMYSKNYYYGNKKNDDKNNNMKKSSKNVEEIIKETITSINNNLEKIENKQFYVENDDKEDLKQDISEQQKQGNSEKEIIINNSNIEMKKLYKQIEKTNINYNSLEDVINKEIQLTKGNYDKLEDTVNKELELTKTNYSRLEDTVNKEMEMTKTNYSKLEDLVNKGIQEIKSENNELLKKEISNIDYTNQINQMNEMITNLKDSYLELANIVKANNEKEEDINNEKVIYIKKLKKQREGHKHIVKEKLEYKMNEDIPYEELEKTAIYKLPINTANSSSNEYEGIM